MRTKESSLAGSWYPAGREELGRLVEALLAEAVPAGLRDIAGMVVPHAGYRYSGRAAAFAYRQLKDRDYRRVVIIAPSHFVSFSGLALAPVDRFRTPLGETPVDRGAVDGLACKPGFRLELEPFREEHSLEIQIPFLQRVLPAATLVPLVAGRMGRDEILAGAEELRCLAGSETIFLASSDFVHYGQRFGFVPFPARGPEQVRDGLARLDRGAIAAILSGDCDRFLGYVGETRATICGQVPIAILMAIVGVGSKGHELCYYTSLDVTGDWTSTVSYAAVAFERDSLG